MLKFGGGKGVEIVGESTASEKIDSLTTKFASVTAGEDKTMMLVFDKTMNFVKKLRNALDFVDDDVV